ncbi:MAG: ABC transporter permease [candidate division FCPU426 bacterium]
MKPKEALLELKGAYKTYTLGGTPVKAMDNVSVSIEAGEFVAIMGPSGSGKSTLLHVLGLLDRPDQGQYVVAGIDTTTRTDDQLAGLRNRLLGFVFQQFHLLPNLTAQANVELPLLYAGRRNHQDAASNRLREVGLAARSDHRPRQMSGGEQQRVAIARSLVNDPLVILADEPTGNLDTKSEAEILRVLEELNRQGITVVMVTHEPEVAARARRILRMRDGKLIADERRKTAAKQKHRAEAPGSGAAWSAEQARGGRAVFTDHLRQALYAIVSHKLRSTLSMLGILIGVAAVIAMLALGQGARDSITKQLASLGSNLLNVHPGSHRFGPVSMEAGAVTRLTPQDSEALRRLPMIKRVAASVQGRAQVVAGANNWNTQVIGAEVPYAEMRASVPTLGRFFTDEEERGRQKVAVIGTTVVQQLFPNSNPVGATVRVNRIPFQIIGVLPTKGATGWRDQDDVMVIPLSTAMYRLLGKEYVDSIDVEVRDAKLMDAAEDAVSALIKQRHPSPNREDEGFEIRNMADLQDTLKQATQTMTLLLGSIAAISLLVGGIGIMNIMLVSVTERTREIGLRKALGARRQDILIQFLIEAVLMTVSGGLAGILLGAGISWGMSTVAKWNTTVSWWSVLLALTFSVGVGLAFGLWPARQAAQLKPIEALRYE